MGVWGILGKIFLFPLAIIYDGITRFRNHLFNIGSKPSFDFDSTVISVGNLSVGGTGKTPMIEYLICLLKDKYSLSTLSRGYGRKTKGIRFASEEDSASTIGDEPYQFYLKFKNEINVTVGEERAFAIPTILHQFPLTEVILLDDAFQHRSVKPQLSILASEFNSPFYIDFVLPAGRLREARSGANRADVIVITKCPTNPNHKIDFSGITEKVQVYAGKKPVFFTGLQYSSPIAFDKASKISDQIILVSGIANSTLLEDYVKANYKLIRHFVFNDHHNFTAADVLKVLDFWKGQSLEVSILTTEKDRVKLIDKKFQSSIDSTPWFYLPIKTYFINDGQNFDTIILNSVVSHNR